MYSDGNIICVPSENTHKEIYSAHPVSKKLLNHWLAIYKANAFFMSVVESERRVMPMLVSYHITSKKQGCDMIKQWQPIATSVAGTTQRQNTIQQSKLLLNL